MREKRLCGLLLLFLLLAACQTQSPADKLRAELKTAASWAATARMAVEMWSGGAVPTRYASRTLEAAAAALEESMSALAAAPDDSSARDMRNTLLAEMQKLQQVFGQMHTAVENQDRAGLAEQLKQLSAVEREVADLKQKAGEQS